MSRDTAPAIALVAGSFAIAAAVVLLTAGASGAAPSPVVHPNPFVANFAIDYAATLRGPGGKPTTLRPLSHAVIAQALADQDYLAYATQGDLGGFRPAPIGHFALSSGGRTIVGETTAPQLPHLAQAGGGRITSFALVGSPPTGPPDNGKQPVPGVGVPPTTPPTGTTTLPPPNQGFGGNPSTTTTTTTTPKPPPTTTTRTTPPTTTTPEPPPTTTATTTTTPTTTTRTTTTTAKTTTVETTTTVTTTASPGTTTTSPPSGASCGTTGLTITSDHSTCRIYAVNMAPGGSASEVMTLRNDTDAPFTISFRATGTQNTLWNDLQLGVWETGTPAPSPLPPLLWWTTQDYDLPIPPLQPGHSIRFTLKLLLSPEAGNSDQNKTATIDFVWRARS